MDNYADRGGSEVAEAWAQDRKAYPGWIIGPNRETQRLRYGFPTLRKEQESAEAHLRFASERIWRHRVAGIWLLPQDLQDADAHFEDAGQNLPQHERIEVCASVAAEWRRYQELDNWARWMARLETIGGEDALLYHAYETAQRALLDWDDATVLKASHALKSDKPIWMMRRAGLLATLFQHRQAAELYQAALLSTRQKLLSAPTSAWLISVEGWAAMFHRVSYSALGDELFARPEDDSDETRMRYVGAKAEPWDVISRLANLASDRIDRNLRDAEPWKLSFKHGRYSPSGTVRAGDDECPFYGLLELIERTGAPENISNFNVFSARLETSYRAITSPDENDLLAFLARYRGTDKKALDWIMPRMQVARLSDEAVVHLLSVIPRRIDRLVALQDRRGGNDYLVFVLELLARVVIRANSARALEIFKWADKLLDSSTLWWGCYSACGAILKGSVETMENEDRQQAMELALHLKTPGEAGAQSIERDWPELFEAFSQEDMQAFSVTSRSLVRIDSLIVLVKTGPELDRGRALRRLHNLYNADKLTQPQKDSLEAAIWGRCSETGWPSDTQLLSWIFLELPGDQRAKKLFHKLIIGGVAKGQIAPEILRNLRAGLGRVDLEIAKETLVDCVRNCLNWAPVSTEGRDQFCLALSGDAQLNEATAREIGEVLTQSLLPRLNADDLPKDVSDQLKKPQELRHLKSMAATAFQITRLWPAQQASALALVRAAIASRDPIRVYPAYIAIMQFTANATSGADVPREIKDMLLHNCEQRTQPGLSSALELLGDMIDDCLLNDDDIARISNALPDILEEYHYDQQTLTVPAMAELPSVRKAVHRLSEMLRDHCTDLETHKVNLVNDPLPEVRFLNPKNQHVE